MRSLADAVAMAKCADQTSVTGPMLVPPIIVARRFADIVEETVEWHWQDWIAKGKLHLCAGVQGDGKSTILTDIAARLSSGTAMPDGVAVTPKRIGFLISEDGLADTVLPRLRIHGANLDYVLAIEAVRPGDADAPLSLSAHLSLLEQFITDNQLDLLIIDALSDFLGSIRRNDEGEVRSVLTPLSQLAGRTGCAVIGIAHLGKPGAGARRAVERVLGSGAFTQVARIVWAVSTDIEDEAKRYFGQVKNNLAPDVASYEWHRDRDMPISWDGVSASSVKTMMSGAAEKSSKVDRAIAFLTELLMGGGKPSTVVFEHGALAGIRRDPLYAAAKELGVRKEKEAGLGGQWYWRLPNAEPHTPSGTYVSSSTSSSSGRYVSSGSDVPERRELTHVSELDDVGQDDISLGDEAA